MRKIVLGFVLGALAFASLSNADDDPPTWTRWSGVVRHDISTPVEVRGKSRAAVRDDGRVELAKGFTCEDVLREQAGLVRGVDGVWRR